jgi:hypothetical protein
MEWFKRILDGFCLTVKILKIAALPNPSFPERVLLATAEGKFCAYHEKMLVERCIKGWLTLHTGRELADVEVWNLMFSLDDGDCPPGWKKRAQQSLQELVDNGIVRSRGNYRIGYDEYPFFKLPIDFALIIPKGPPEKSSNGIALTSGGIALDQQEKIHELSCVIQSLSQKETKTIHSDDGLRRTPGTPHWPDSVMLKVAQDKDPKIRSTCIEEFGLPLSILKELSDDKDPAVRTKALAWWRLCSAGTTNHRPKMGRT